MKIEVLIECPHGEKILDTSYPENNPLGGSETAALKMVDFFRSLGHDVEIKTKCEILKSNTCDIFIALRKWHSLAQGIRPGKLNYLWCQDDANQPLVKHLENPDYANAVWQNCTGVMMISHYQIQEWVKNLHLPQEKIFLTQNGIDLSKFSIDRAKIKERRPKAYYSSTPFRGLNLLLEFWPLVRDLVPDAELTITSSMGTYHLPHLDEEFEQLFEKAKKMEGVIYLPGVNQSRLREIAQESRVLAYPCIFPETGCIAAMEAMASGVAVVGTAIGALPETAWRNPLFHPTGDWFKLWTWETARLLVDHDYYEELALQNLEVAKNMDWKIIGHRWIRRFVMDFSQNGFRVNPHLQFV